MTKIKRKVRFRIIKYKHAPSAPHGVVRQELDQDDYVIKDTLLSAHPTRKEAKHTIEAMGRIFAPGVVQP